MVCISVPTAMATADVAAGASTFAAAAAADATASFAAAAAAGGSFASSLATAGTIASLVGSGVSAFGAIKQGQASAASAKYNSSVAAMNQEIANQNSVRAGQVGSKEVEAQQLKTRAEVGQIQSNMAASGLDSSSGSSAEVIKSATEIGQLNALSIRANATQQAYNYKTQGVGYGAESGLYESTASNDKTAGYISGGSTVLSGVGDAGLTYGKFLSSNATL